VRTWILLSVIATGSCLSVGCSGGGLVVVALDTEEERLVISRSSGSSTPQFLADPDTYDGYPNDVNLSPDGDLIALCCGGIIGLDGQVLSDAEEIRLPRWTANGQRLLGVQNRALVQVDIEGDVSGYDVEGCAEIHAVAPAPQAGRAAFVCHPTIAADGVFNVVVADEDGGSPEVLGQGAIDADSHDDAWAWPRLDYADGWVLLHNGMSAADTGGLADQGLHALPEGGGGPETVYAGTVFSSLVSPEGGTLLVLPGYEDTFEIAEVGDWTLSPTSLVTGETFGFYGLDWMDEQTVCVAGAGDEVEFRDVDTGDTEIHALQPDPPPGPGPRPQQVRVDGQVLTCRR
jgi:hypothetical protein